LTLREELLEDDAETGRGLWSKLVDRSLMFDDVLDGDTWPELSANTCLFSWPSDTWLNFEFDCCSAATDIEESVIGIALEFAAWF
jgi:hypothetical protein